MSPVTTMKAERDIATALYQGALEACRRIVKAGEDKNIVKMALMFNLVIHLNKVAR